MPDVQHKRGPRAALDVLAGASGLLLGQIYIIADEDRLAFATSESTYATTLRGNEGWVQITQAEYDALSPPDPGTLYVIVG